MDSLAEITAELDKADAARKRGNEGQARVCARRAAGIAAREYLSRRVQHLPSSSAYDLLRLVADDSTVEGAIRRSASHLILRVDEQFKLPEGIDLIEEARALCRALLPGPALKP